METSRKRKKKVEKDSWRKKKGGRFWNEVESRENKKERMEIYGYTCVAEKNQEKKKKKRMDDGKKERKNNIKKKK